MNIAGIIHESLNDGDGIRMVIFISGCYHNCKNCQNHRLFDFHYGRPFDKSKQDYIIDYLRKDPLVDGITLSGGDPVYSHAELTPFLSKIKKEFPNKNIWMYTGFNFEDIKDNELLKYVDVVVDGVFIESLKDTTLKFRGSSNQRIINVKKTLQNGEIVLWEK